MIKQVLFAAAAVSAAIGATLTATGPALAQTAHGEGSAAQIAGAMRSVSLVEAMADAESRAEFGLSGRPVHTVMVDAPAARTPADTPAIAGANHTVPSPRLAMLGGFSIDEDRLADIMVGSGIDIVRARPMTNLAGLASDDHDFGNTGFSEVDAFHTDRSPSRIGIRFSF